MFVPDTQSQVGANGVARFFVRVGSQIKNGEAFCATRHRVPKRPSCPYGGNPGDGESSRPDNQAERQLVGFGRSFSPMLACGLLLRHVYKVRNLPERELNDAKPKCSNEAVSIRHPTAKE